MIVSLLNFAYFLVFCSWKVKYFTGRSELLDIELSFLGVRNRGHPNRSVCAFSVIDSIEILVCVTKTNKDKYVTI